MYNFFIAKSMKKGIFTFLESYSLLTCISCSYSSIPTPSTGDERNKLNLNCKYIDIDSSNDSDFNNIEKIECQQHNFVFFQNILINKNLRRNLL